MQKVPWWVWAVVVGGGIGLFARVGWKSLVPEDHQHIHTSFGAAKPQSAELREQDVHLVANDILLQMQKHSASASKVTDAEAVSGGMPSLPPLVLQPPPKVELKVQPAFKSSWHSANFKEECGGMSSAIEKLQTEYKVRVVIANTANDTSVFALTTNFTLV
jgi:hypothetical protein